MKIGIVPINVGGASVAKAVDLAVAAEAIGVESVWTCEHVIIPSNYDSVYPYSETGKMPTGPTTNFVDPLVTLAFIAARTTTIRLATGINILPQTNPLMFAKQVASVDFLSGGRFILGVGVGWLEEEFKAMGTPFARRSARFQDYLIAIRKVWKGESVEHRSEFLDWSGFTSHPVPVQKHVPIIIGGSSDAALRRVVRLGDGWISPPASLEEVRERIDKLREYADDANRDFSRLDITAMHPAVKFDPASVERYRAAGATRLVVPTFSIREPNPIEGLKQLAPHCTN